MKKLIAVVTTAGLLTLGAAGTAFAASNGTSTTRAAATTATAKAKPGQGRHLRRAARRLAVKTAADTIGIAPRDLIRAVRSGQTVAQVAEAHGVTASTVINAVVKALDDKIDRAVTNGTLGAARAAKLKE